MAAGRRYRGGPKRKPGSAEYYHTGGVRRSPGSLVNVICTDKHMAHASSSAARAQHTLVQQHEKCRIAPLHRPHARKDTTPGEQRRATAAPKIKKYPHTHHTPLDPTHLINHSCHHLPCCGFTGDPQPAPAQGLQSKVHSAAATTTATFTTRYHYSSLRLIQPAVGAGGEGSS